MNSFPYDSKNAPKPFFLNFLLRSLMLLTRRRGMLTLAKLNVRLFPKGEIIKLPGGNALFLPPDPHFIGYLLSRHEHHIAELMARKIRPGDLCLDVGANIGYFTGIMAAFCAPGGKVLAYEPDVDNFAVLEVNAQFARTAHVAVWPSRVAVSNANSILYLRKGAQSTLHRVEEVTELQPSEDTVPSVRLSDCPALARTIIRFLKVDVEGHELSVLEGCEELLSRGGIKTAVVEVSPGAIARRIGALLGRWNPAVNCWLDHAWKAHPLEHLPYRTDVWFDFESSNFKIARQTSSR